MLLCLKWVRFIYRFWETFQQKMLQKMLQRQVRVIEVQRVGSARYFIRSATRSSCCELSKGADITVGNSPMHWSLSPAGGSLTCKAVCQWHSYWLARAHIAPRSDDCKLCGTMCVERCGEASRTLCPRSRRQQPHSYKVVSCKCADRTGIL